MIVQKTSGKGGGFEGLSKFIRSITLEDVRTVSGLVVDVCDSVADIRQRRAEGVSSGETEKGEVTK